MLTEPALIDKIWPKIWPLIKASVNDFDVETEDDILEDLRSAARLLIVAGDGIAIIRTCGVRKKFLEINYIGGKNIKKWWPKMSEHLDAIAKATGCEKVISFGRPAWAKVAPDYTETKNRMYIKEVA